MPQTETVNRHIVLAAHPNGMPAPGDLRLEEGPVPQPGEGEVLVRTLFLSLDPYMRGLMNPIGPAYAPAVKRGETMVGGTVGRVVASRNPRFAAGDLVLGRAGWQDYSTSDGSDLMALGEPERPSLALGTLGMPGFTAYVGLLDIGRPRPGETVVVAAATGPVGSAVGQIAKLAGARVVGIAGGADKCRWAVEELGFDACLDHRAPGLPDRLAAACPDGIDIYFENVGGAVFDAVMPLLNFHARVPMCGSIADYNGPGDGGVDRLPRFVMAIVGKRLRAEGFIINDHYATRFSSFRRDMGRWIAEGAVMVREDVVDGLENAPAAFNRLLEGKNFGKLVVRVAADG